MLVTAQGCEQSLPQTNDLYAVVEDHMRNHSACMHCLQSCLKHEIN
jgi:hypothetical protein